MSNGPIEFLGDVPVSVDQKPATEFGGTAGLIQPESVAGADAHSVLTEEEVRGIARRYGGVPLTSSQAWTGEIEDETIVDPATGRVVDEALLEEVTGTGGALSDLKPK
jgi:hypothetical protein